MKAAYQELIKALGLPDLPEELIDIALTHVSAVRERGMPLHLSNERHEFLGDAVLELAVSHILYSEMPTADEGELTRLRAQLVCRDNLAHHAEKLALGELIIFSKGEKQAGGARKKALLADALEALIGVVFFTHGYQQAFESIKRLLFDGQDLHQLPMRSSHHWKSRFQEMMQRSGPREIAYSSVQSGSDHLPSFSVVLSVDGVVYGEGVGKSKQEAEQNAAKEAIRLLEAGGYDIALKGY